MGWELPSLSNQQAMMEKILSYCGCSLQPLLVTLENTSFIRNTNQYGISNKSDHKVSSVVLRSIYSTIRWDN